MLLKFFAKRNKHVNSSEIKQYSFQDIIDFNEKGITLKNGGFIDFEICVREFAKSCGKSSFKCVAERDIDANPPYFEFYMPEHIRIIIDSCKPFPQEYNRKLFREFREKLESYSYTTYDLT